MNKIMIEGRLAQSPECKQTRDGKSMTIFNICCERQYDRGQVDYFHCFTFGNTADYIAKYGATGMDILVFGECQHTKYTDRNGNSQNGENVMVSDVKFKSWNPMENPKNQNRQQPTGGGYGQPTGGYSGNQQYGQPQASDFMTVPDGVNEIPFN